MCIEAMWKIAVAIAGWTEEYNVMNPRFFPLSLSEPSCRLGLGPTNLQKDAGFVYCKRDWAYDWRRNSSRNKYKQIEGVEIVIRRVEAE